MKPDRFVLMLVAAALAPLLCRCTALRALVSATADLRIPKDPIFKGIL